MARCDLGVSWGTLERTRSAGANCGNESSIRPMWKASLWSARNCKLQSKRLEFMIDSGTIVGADADRDI